MARTGSVSVRTPEGIVFSFIPAGPIARFVAWVIDLACVSVILIPLSLVLGLAAQLAADAAQAARIILFFLVSLGYAIVLEWRFKGQTVGKRLLSMRVVDGSGRSLRPAQIIIRNLLRAVDSLPLCYLVGGVSCLLSGRSQRLGDIAAGTMVIRESKAGRPDLGQMASDKYNSLREHRLIVARLRQRTSPREADIALQACLRRADLEPASRVKLFTEIANHFRESIPIPKEVAEGIGAEQLVRDVVEVLFTPGRDYRL